MRLPCREDFGAWGQPPKEVLHIHLGISNGDIFENEVTQEKVKELSPPLSVTFGNLREETACR